MSSVLTAEVRARIAREVAAAPPLSEEQRETLRRLFAVGPAHAGQLLPHAA